MDAEAKSDILEKPHEMLPPPPHEVFKVSSKLSQFDAKDFRTSYDKTDFIGCGAFGAVRKSSHKVLGSVVVKCASLKGTKQCIEKGIKSFKREANVLVRVRHPNIVHIFGVTIWSNNVGIVLEYLHCGNLSNFLKNKNIKHISWWVRTMFAHQLAAALAFLHRHESHLPFCHGDIKPENVLLTLQLVAKLADFGAANIIRVTKVESTTLEMVDTSQHTPLYVAPECYNLDEQSPRTSTSAMDMYRGERPSPEHLKKTLESIDEEEDKYIFNMLKDIMENCWDGKPSNRPSSSIVRDLLGEQLVHIRVDQVMKEIAKLQPLLTDNNEAKAFVQLSGFESPFMQSNLDLSKNIDSYDLPHKVTDQQKDRADDYLHKEPHSRDRRRHKFTALSRRSWGDNGMECLLLVSFERSFATGKMWRIKFVSDNQGRNRPSRVYGSVSKMDIFCRDVEISSWSEARSALLSHFDGVEQAEKVDAAPSQHAAPLGNSFAFSLFRIVHPDKERLANELTKQGLSLRMWKHPSKYAINGVVICRTLWEIEGLAAWLGKVFGKENIAFVQCGFEEEKYLADDLD